MKNAILGVLVLWGISVQCMERTLSSHGFYAAICENDQKTIQLGIAMARDGKIDVNARNHAGNWTALMKAAERGVVEIVIELVKIPGIDANAKDTMGRTALMWAAEDGRTEVVRELLNVPGIDVSAKDKEGKTVLMLAARCGLIDIVREVLKAPGIDVNARNNYGSTALILAAKGNGGMLGLMQAGGRTGVVRELLKAHGIDVNAQDNDCRTALMLAGVFVTVVRELLKAPGIDVNARDNGGLTALMLAAMNGRTSAVIELLKVPGIDVSIKNAEGHSALAIAIKKSEGQIALLLWAVGAHEESIQELLPAMQEAREKGKAVFDGIKSALKSGSIDALKKYAKDGFSLMIMDSQGNNPVHIAVMHNQRELARWLIDYGKQWLIKRNKDELNPLDVIYGRWIAESNNEWVSFVEELPEEFKPDAEKAKEDWQRYKEKAFNEGHEGMAASLMKK